MLTISAAMRTTSSASLPAGSGARVARIISGGQTGADRAALDFAIAAGVPYGGWVPRGGWAEDHVESPGLLQRYPHLVAAESDDPLVRSRLNVKDADATVVVRLGPARSPGTSATWRAAQLLDRPLLDVDLLEQRPTEALHAFLRGFNSLIVLNVAGPRESESPGLYRATYAFLEAHAGLFQASPTNSAT